MFFYDDRVILVREELIKDNEGYSKPVRTRREVWANIKSVARTEFFNSLKAGTLVTKTIELAFDEYEDEKLVEIDGVMFEFVRSYRLNPDVIQLNLKEVQRKDGQR